MYILMASEYSHFALLLAAGTFHQEECLCLSNRNSILMTQDLSGIGSEALIGRMKRTQWNTRDKKIWLSMHLKILVLTKLSKQHTHIHSFMLAELKWHTD